MSNTHDILKDILQDSCIPHHNPGFHSHPVLTELAESGIPKGGIVEVVGSHSSGKTTFARQLLQGFPPENVLLLDIAHSPQQEGLQASSLETASEVIRKSLSLSSTQAILWDNSNLFDEPEYPERFRRYAQELSSISQVLRETDKILIRVSLCHAETPDQLLAGRMTRTEGDIHSTIRIGISYPWAVLLRPADSRQGRNWGYKARFAMPPDEEKE